jgi:hypothetical protein
MAIGILVLLSGEDFNESRNVAIAGKKYPEKTPKNFARNIHGVRYLSRNDSYFIIFQQQFELASEHPHVGSEFLNIPLIIPAAQPTPELTVIAFTGQLSSHAPHSIQ